MKTLLGHYRSTFRFDAWLTEWGGSLMSLALRLYVGSVFFKSGLTKIADWDSTVQLFTDEYHTPLLSPEAAAVMGAAGELGLPLLLFVGLLSRPAALGLFAVNLMAVVSYPQLWKFDCPAAINDHKYWGILLLALVVFGPGRFALDAWLGGRRQGGAAVTLT
jgi:putative oxidoreductase